jgi:hypothetical protein
MSFGKNPPEGELPEPNQLYNDPEIEDIDSFTPNSKIHTPFYRRRGFKKTVAVGVSTLALGATLFLGGCGKPRSTPQGTAQQTTQEQVVEQQTPEETQQPAPEDIIVMRDTNEVSPRIVRQIRESLGGLAYVDSQGWIHPNEVDGTYGHYDYDFSDPNQVVLAAIEAINNNDRMLLYATLWYLPDIVEDMYYFYIVNEEFIQENLRIGEREKSLLLKINGFISNPQNLIENQPLNEAEKRMLLDLVYKYVQTLDSEMPELSERYGIIEKYRIYEFREEYPDLSRRYSSIEIKQRLYQPLLGEDLCPDITDVHVLTIECENSAYDTPFGFIAILLKISQKYVLAYFEI